jgi:hypothetical protein
LKVNIRWFIIKTKKEVVPKGQPLFIKSHSLHQTGSNPENYHLCERLILSSNATVGVTLNHADGKTPPQYFRDFTPFHIYSSAKMTARSPLALLLRAAFQTFLIYLLTKQHSKTVW